MTRVHRIAVVPGDGIGPEVIDEAIKVLEAAAPAHEISFEFEWLDLGADRYLRTGDILTDADLEAISFKDAVLLGAVGDPRVAPGILESGLLLRLRRELDLYANLRPARLLPGVPSPLTATEPSNLNFTVVRENTEGLYSGRGGIENLGENEAVTEISVNTENAVTRIVEFAFEVAQREKRSLNLVHKINVLERAGGLYRRVVELVSERFPDVKVGYQHVDAAALLMVTDPVRFEVIVTDNLFGDILSDLASGLTGGIGYAASGNIHPGRVSVFEPVHGSAPDIAGKGIANPIGAILSAVLMLRHLGEAAAADSIESAVEAFTATGLSLDTASTGNRVAEAVAI